MSDNQDKNKVGRPKEEFSLWEGWYDDILNLYREGAAHEEIKALIWEYRGSFSNDLWDRWKREEVEFSETIKAGTILSKAWWLKEGRTNLKTIKDMTGVSTSFNYTGWYMQMKNRFGWKDKTENENTGEIKYTIVKSETQKDEL